VAGGKLQMTTNWKFCNNSTADNSSGFFALPSGCRYYGGAFSYIGSHSIWWSSSEYNSDAALVRKLSYFNYVTQAINVKKNGLSVRCVKN
ncbi:MAG: FISUMP domain-containing protein, partial [bacterium]